MCRKPNRFSAMLSSHCHLPSRPHLSFLVSKQIPHKPQYLGRREKLQPDLPWHAASALTTHEHSHHMRCRKCFHMLRIPCECVAAGLTYESQVHGKVAFARRTARRSTERRWRPRRWHIQSHPRFRGHRFSQTRGRVRRARRCTGRRDSASHTLHRVDDAMPQKPHLTQSLGLRSR